MNLLRLTCSSIMLTGMIFLSSCSSVNINSASPILVPSGLLTQEVKLAIISAVYPEKAPREWTPVEAMTDSALRAFFGFSYDRVNKGQHWFVEDVRSDSVLVGFDSDDQYFRVEYQIRNGQIAQRIDGSRNLNQTKNEIDEDVFEWLGSMESRIRQSMGNVAAMKADFEQKPKK